MHVFGAAVLTNTLISWHETCVFQNGCFSFWQFGVCRRNLDASICVEGKNGFSPVFREREAKSGKRHWVRGNFESRSHGSCINCEVVLVENETKQSFPSGRFFKCCQIVHCLIASHLFHSCHLAANCHRFLHAVVESASLTKSSRNFGWKANRTIIFRIKKIERTVDAWWVTRFSLI